VSAVTDIEALVTANFAAVAGITNALDHEPQRLPKMPVVTLLCVRYDPVDAETGIGQDVTYQWLVRLYVPLNDWRTSQQSLKELVPLLLNAVRDDPTLGDYVDFLTLRDSGSEPEFNTDGGYVTKRLTLTASLCER